MPTLAERLEQALAGSPLQARLGAAAEGVFERRSRDPAAAQLEGPALVGLARALASGGDAARYLSHRPELLARIAAARPGCLRARAVEIHSRGVDVREPSDLEAFLDAIRLLRRDETLFAAVVDLAGLAPFEEVSEFLSHVAESIACLALEQAQRGQPAAVSVIGLGKIAGRELTYGSDLDLIYLYEGTPAEVAERSRVAHRLIAYLSTMTGAGVAYTVDSRLRPSGRQGMLVTTLDAFERYQREQAALWEHLALMRARVLAPEQSPAQARLDEIRAAVSGGSSPWAGVHEMRERVLKERGTEAEAEIRFKAGRGGLMDVGFIGTGALLERGASRLDHALPALPRMLHACARGPGVERVLAAYRLLRLVEARSRWLAGRPVELLRRDADTLPLVADLVEPGLQADALLARIDEARAAVERAYDAIIAADGIQALERA